MKENKIFAVLYKLKQLKRKPERKTFIYVYSGFQLSVESKQVFALVLLYYNRQTETNRDLVARVFPRLASVTFYLLRVLIGSLCCSRQL